MSSLPLGSSELNRLPARWLCEIFLTAPLDILVPLLKAWIEPMLKMSVSGYEYEYYSVDYGACIGVCVARANGTGAILAACEALMVNAISLDSMASRESVHYLLADVIKYAGVGISPDFHRILTEGSRLVHSQALDYLPKFAWCMQS